MEAHNDLLIFMACYNMRLSLMNKARIYAGAAFQLAPNDLRAREIHGYILLLDGELDRCEAVVTSGGPSSNLSYLRARLSLLRGQVAQAGQHLRDYLALRAAESAAEGGKGTGDAGGAAA